MKRSFRLTVTLRWPPQRVSEVLAVRMLGLALALGRGVERNVVAAFQWIHFAAEAGDDGANQARQFLTKEMADAQIAEAKGLAARFQAEPRRGHPVSDGWADLHLILVIATIDQAGATTQRVL